MTAMEEYSPGGAEVVGYTTRKNNDWFDEDDPEIQDLHRKHSWFEGILAKPDNQATKATYGGRNACSTSVGRD